MKSKCNAENEIITIDEDSNPAASSMVNFTNLNYNNDCKKAKFLPRIETNSKNAKKSRDFYNDIRNDIYKVFLYPESEESQKLLCTEDYSKNFQNLFLQNLCN